MRRIRARVQAIGRPISALLLGCALLPAQGKAADTEAHSGLPQQSAETAKPEPAPAALAPLIVVQSHTLLEGQARLAWAGAAPFSATEPLTPKAHGRHAYRTQVDPGRLPADLRERLEIIQHTGLDLYDAGGKRCGARLANPELHLELHADSPEPKSGKLTFSEIPPRSQLWLVARVESEDADCQAATWALPTGSRAPSIWQRQNQTPAAVARIARVRRAFLRSETYAELKQAFLAQQAAEAGQNEQRWRQAVQRGLRFEYWSAPAGEEGLVFMHFEIPTPGDSAGWVVQINREGQQLIDAPMQPIAVFDADGDGIVEILEEDDHGRWLFEGSPDLLSGWSFVGPDDLDGC